jgi:hypothetical protein
MPEGETEVQSKGSPRHVRRFRAISLVRRVHSGVFVILAMTFAE